MPNAFNKEEIVAWEQLCEGFEDSEVMAKNVSKYQISGTDAARTNDTMWRPMPYIATSYDGMDQTNNFKEKTQLAVPATIGFKKSSPFLLDASELRDALQQQRLGESARQKLASDINTAVARTAAMQGTVVVTRTGSASSYDDISLADAALTEQGINSENRKFILSARDYNGLAGDLAKSTRSFTGNKSNDAYTRSFVGEVAGFDTFKADYVPRLTAAVATGVTIGAVNQYYVPKATSTASTGEVGNVDNRYQTITVANTTGALKAGDCFTIAGVESVHHINKEATGQLKTFRVISVNSATSIVISPPIISAQGASEAEKQYQNVSATPVNGAVVNILNIKTAYANPFWHRNAIELIPAVAAVPRDAGAAVMTYTTSSGIEIVFQKQYDINTMKTKFRLDTWFGVVMTNPEMCGIELFNQS